MKLCMFLLSLVQSVFGYKPVVLVHGVLSEASHLEDLKDMIEKAHPGTNVTMVKLYPEVESFIPLPHQLKYWREKVEPIMADSPEGIHLICHSQGGLICQGITEYCADHNVHTFIALSSPINGQFGIPSFVSNYMPWLKGKRESLTKYMYSTFTQTTLAISNYWRDPRQEYWSEFLSYAHYLPVVQNNKYSKQVKSLDAIQRRKNFLRLKKLVLIGGPDDGVIIPWQSAVYGYYDSNYAIVHMKNQSVFLQDWFGLRTLYDRGGIATYIIPGVKHIGWHGNATVFHNAIKQWLV